MGQGRENPMIAVPIGIALVLLAVAWVFHWRSWGNGKWSIGPRVVALCVITAAVGLASVVAAVVSAIFGWLTAFAVDVADSIGHPGGDNVIRGIGTYGPGIAGAILLIIWLLALLPDMILPTSGREKMTWELAWAGLLIPGMILLSFPFVQHTGTVIVTAIASGVGNVASGLMQAGQHAVTTR